MPDHEVLLNKMTVLEQIIKTSRLTVIISPRVLARLDKIKKESPQAREAIRWLETSLSSGRRVRMGTSVSTGSGPSWLEQEAEHLLAEKKLLNRNSLFVTVLTSQKEEEKSDGTTNGNTKKAAISVEHVDSFFLRLVTQDDGAIYK
ncbi:PIN domain-containing protein [Ditylenchus destructor]|nr:PIN domain-containing protein [Ditylenchus destructor]